MAAGFFQSEWAQRKQGGSHNITYTLALGVTIFCGLHESRKGGNTRRQELLRATVGADYHNHKILKTSEASIC